MQNHTHWETVEKNSSFKGHPECTGRNSLTNPRASTKWKENCWSSLWDPRIRESHHLISPGLSCPHLLQAPAAPRKPWPRNCPQPGYTSDPNALPVWPWAQHSPRNNLTWACSSLSCPIKSASDAALPRACPWPLKLQQACQSHQVLVLYTEGTARQSHSFKTRRRSCVT